MEPGIPTRYLRSKELLGFVRHQCITDEYNEKDKGQLESTLISRPLTAYAAGLGLIAAMRHTHNPRLFQI